MYNVIKILCFKGVILNTGQSKIQHNLRVLDGVIDEIAFRFHQFKKSDIIVGEDEDPSTAKNEHLSMLAGKIGYLVNISASSTKTFHLEQRITELEEENNNPISAEVRKEYQFNPDIMLTLVRDEKGKLMN